MCHIWIFCVIISRKSEKNSFELRPTVKKKAVLQESRKSAKRETAVSVQIPTRWEQSQHIQWIESYCGVEVVQELRCFDWCEADLIRFLALLGAQNAIRKNALAE